MDISKLKLILRWFLFITGFYIFWLIAYFLSAWFTLYQLRRFSDQRPNIWKELTAADFFWYFLFLVGLLLIMYVVKLFTKHAPNSKIAGLVYVVLIVISLFILLTDSSFISKGLSKTPHLILNTIFVIPIVQILIKKPDTPTEEDFSEDTD